MMSLRFGRVGIFVAWFDCWVGAYYNQEKRRLYLMVPFAGVWIDFKGAGA